MVLLFKLTGNIEANQIVQSSRDMRKHYTNVTLAIIEWWFILCRSQSILILAKDGVFYFWNANYFI